MSKLIEVQHMATVHLTENAIALFGDGSCAFCHHEKIEYLLCLIVQELPYADYEYEKNPQLNQFLLDLRSEFGHNFELPVCAAHCEGPYLEQ